MRTFLTCLVFGRVLLPGAFAGILDFLFPKHDVQVITVTDTTPAGAALRPASPADPVYYVAVNAGYRELGGIIAGEKTPPSQEVIKNMTRVLAKQGYLPATKAHPPLLLLLWTWGTLNTDRFYDPSSDDTEGRQINRQQMLRFLGAYKLGLVSKQPQSFEENPLLPGLSFMDNDAEAIADAATDDLYIAAVAAYDFQAATRKEKKLLWMTKISCPSRGLSLPEVLPSMLAIAGPMIGRETARPVWINASDKFKTEVKIGDPTLVEFIEIDNLPVIDATQLPGSKPPPGKKNVPGKKR